MDVPVIQAETMADFIKQLEEAEALDTPLNREVAKLNAHIKEVELAFKTQFEKWVAENDAKQAARPWNSPEAAEEWYEFLLS